MSYLKFTKKILVCILVLHFTGTNAEETHKDEKSIDAFIGVSMVPSAKWSFPSLLNYENSKLSYNMDQNTFTTYDANIRFTKIQTILGFSAVTEKNTSAGKFHDFSGHLGFKHMYFRLMKGKISGHGSWHAAAATNMPTEFDFDNSLTSYDVLYSMQEMSDPKKTTETNSPGRPDTGFYLGLGTTHGEAPVIIRTLVTTGGKANQKYGKFVYDKNYQISVVSFLFGFDTVTGAVLANHVLPGAIQVYATSYDRMGFGSGTISSTSVQYAESLNPGKKFVDRKGSLVYLENNSSLGVSWSPSFLNGKAILALGYNLFFNSIMPMSGAAESSTDLGYDANTGMLHHGPEIRFFAIW